MTTGTEPTLKASAISGLQRVSTVVENCPECWAQCWWCSATRLMCREIGCCPGFGIKKKCEKGEAAKGVPCSTCDGGGKVRVRREILGAA